MYGEQVVLVWGLGAAGKGGADGVEGVLAAEGVVGGHCVFERAAHGAENVCMCVAAPL